MNYANIYQPEVILLTGSESYQYTARRLLDGALSRSFGFRIL